VGIDELSGTFGSRPSLIDGPGRGTLQAGVGASGPPELGDRRRTLVSHPRGVLFLRRKPPWALDPADSGPKLLEVIAGLRKPGQARADRLPGSGPTSLTSRRRSGLCRIAVRDNSRPDGIVAGSDLRAALLRPALAGKWWDEEGGLGFGPVSFC